MSDYERGYEQGYADGHADGFTKGSLAARQYDPVEEDAVEEKFKNQKGKAHCRIVKEIKAGLLSYPVDNINPLGVISALRGALLDLEDENARLIAQLRGYVLAGSRKGPGELKPDNLGLYSARGLSREAYKPRWRYPFVLGPDGSWKRAKGRLRIEDWATRLPPRVCEACGYLFVTGRRDTKTCSPRCRVALHRLKRNGRPG